jgi:hypothetical protein
MSDPTQGRFEYSFLDAGFYYMSKCRECGRERHRLVHAPCPKRESDRSGTFHLVPESCPDCQAKTADRIADEMLATP